MTRTIKTALFTAQAALIAVVLTACKQQTGGNPTETPKAANTTPATAVAADDEGWTFATVPLPEGGNPPRFVSNPDGVLSPEAEAELNRILLYAKVDLGIESCIVAVNHVYESNVESFAFALFENFKPNDDMLVIVLAYQDKGVRMEIGHELEARLSEVECQQMLNNIMIPYLRENNPDEGMLSLVEAVYHKIEGKQ
jgi:uncharacterized membrane protein YgcG